MKKLFLFLAAYCLVFDSAFSQTAPAIQWQNTIGGSDNDLLLSIQQTSDGGYILSGYSNSNISGDKTENSNGDADYWIVKTDSYGNIQWQNTIGGDTTDLLYSFSQTAEGGFILGGTSMSNISGDKTENSVGNYDYWIVKTDSLGNIQWQNTIGGSDEDWLTSIQETTDGSYILGGNSQSNISGDKTENNWDTICLPFCTTDYWIVKIDSSGNIQWQNTIGGSDVEYLRSMQQTGDGGYIMGGPSLSNISGDKTENSNGDVDYWIVKTDSSGNIQWQNTIGGTYHDQLYSIQQTTDSGYVLGGFSGSNISGDKTENSMGGFDYWIIKLAPDTITGIPNFNLPVSDFQIYPNPADEEFTVSGSQFPVEKIEIINLLGEIVFSREPKTVNCKLQTSFLPRGMYIVKVYSEKGVFQQKLIVH